jgi:hypothetical protein
VRRDSGDANGGGILLEHLPDDLLAQALANNAAVPFHWPKKMTGSDARGQGPRVGRHFHPSRHRRGAYAPVFSDEIDYAPPAITLLNMRERERRDLRASQSAAEKDRQDGTISQPDDGRDVRRA